MYSYLFKLYEVILINISSRIYRTLAFSKKVTTYLTHYQIAKIKKLKVLV
jgi:hypothetical protein